MSLAVLRSTPLGYNQQTLNDALSVLPSPTQRPKLTLNTTNVTQGSTSLRLETLSATSPTAINTFQNRDGGKTASAAKPSRPSLLSLQTNIDNSTIDSPIPSQIPLPESEDTPILSTSPLAFSPSTSFPASAPYTLPINTTSILTNGPIPRRDSRDASYSSQSAPPTPPQKRVSFRDQLTEDIQTTQFTLRHSDIEEALAIQAANTSSSGSGDAAAEKSKAVKSGSKRDSIELEPSDSCPATPVAGRAKRHKWVWTIEPNLSASSSSPAEVVGEC